MPLLQVLDEGPVGTRLARFGGIPVRDQLATDGGDGCSKRADRVSSSAETCARNDKSQVMTHMQQDSRQECGRCLIEAQTAQGTAFRRVASRRHDATFLVKLLELGRRERESVRETGWGRSM